jgi:hypothetical protein
MVIPYSAVVGGFGDSTKAAAKLLDLLIAGLKGKCALSV